MSNSIEKNIDTSQNNKAETENIQVVLEYSWNQHRDLIASVQAEKLVVESWVTSVNENEATVQYEFSLRSVIESLSSKGFDLEPDHRISYKDTAKNLYVFIGKASDRTTLDSFNLPMSAFTTSSAGIHELILLVREAGTGIGGLKPATVASKTNEEISDTHKKYFEDKLLAVVQ